jgi:hypothetical protein
MNVPWGRQGKRKASSRNHGRRRTLETMEYKDLVKVLDREFSLFVRLSGADKSGLVKCVTCGSIHYWSKITLGHYISRSHHSVRWNLHNVGPQCVRCNSYHGGEQYKMRAHLIRLYGEKAIKKLEEWADMTRTETADSLRMQVIEYREKVKRLKIETGL